MAHDGTRAEWAGNGAGWRNGGLRPFDDTMIGLAEMGVGILSGLWQSVRTSGPKAGDSGACGCAARAREDLPALIG